MLWPLLLAVPLGGLVLLLARPELDVHWEHHPAHFWLVLGESAVSVALGALTSSAATRRGDARLFLVSLAFLSAAGFLGLHALATPGVLLENKNTGFVVATAVGLFLASIFAAASALTLRPETNARILASARLALWTLGLLFVAWAAWSLAKLPPLDRPLPPNEADAPLYSLALPAVVLYAFASYRYLRLYRSRPAPVLAGVTAAWILLAEATIAVAFARNWHASWWEWHLLMATAFGLVAYTALRERTRGELFAGLYLDDTLGRIDRRYADAVKAAAAEGLSQAELQRRFGLGAEEAAVAERAAREVEEVEGLLIMVVFNAAADQPDHAHRAAAAGLALQRAAAELAAADPTRPRFRVGINTGPAIVGNVGTAEQRSFTAIGDTTNLAARLQTYADPGQVVVGETTHQAICDQAHTEPLGDLELKGKSAPVMAYLLLDLR
jgi:adenylate cyclase